MQSVLESMFWLPLSNAASCTIESHLYNSVPSPGSGMCLGLTKLNVECAITMSLKCYKNYRIIKD